MSGNKSALSASSCKRKSTTSIPTTSTQAAEGTYMSKFLEKKAKVAPTLLTKKMVDLNIGENYEVLNIYAFDGQFDRSVVIQLCGSDETPFRAYLPKSMSRVLDSDQGILDFQQHIKYLRILGKNKYNSVDITYLHTIEENANISATTKAYMDNLLEKIAECTHTIPRKPLVEMNLGEIYKIIDVTAFEGPHGRAITIKLRSSDNVLFQTFLPKSMSKVLDTEEELLQFKINMKYLKITEKTRKSANIVYLDTLEKTE